VKKVRIANAGGFWGDWLEAPKNQVLGGKIDYLTIDYLAELTMSMLARQLVTYPDRGYVFDFVRMLEELLPEIKKRKIKVISNAGGMNPKGCALQIKKIAEKLGIDIKIAFVAGDDFKDQIGNLELSQLETKESIKAISSKVTSANAYLGSDPIVEALKDGAEIVVTGRISDASLTVAPLMYEFDWKSDDWDKLALGVVLGHILECGAQATGGNCSYDWKAVPELESVGFPIVEVSSDLTAIVTKHPNTGGEVTIPTVTEQLIYEIGDPRNYISPDVIADFTSIKLEEISKDQIKVSGVKGKPRTEFYKGSISYEAGYKADGSLLFSWPDALEKAKAGDKIIRNRLTKLGLKFEEIFTEFIGHSACHGAIGTASDPNEVLLRIAVRGHDKKAVDRFVRELAPLVLSGPPGISGYAGSRGGAEEIFAYWPTLVPRSAITPVWECV
jgi:hypothetical protein